jgi:putative tryptophan/tyrosine transport system substrate-binding protein
MRRRELLLLSAAITAPRSVSAQHRGSALVGVLDPTPGPHQSTLGSFREGLEDAGYGRGLVSVDYRWTDNSFNHLLLSAIDLVIADVDVIVTGTFDGIRAAKAATSSIPIVFFGDRHVVAAGLMENSDRPSERLAGIVIPSEGDLERFELLIKLVPRSA